MIFLKMLIKLRINEKNVIYGFDSVGLVGNWMLVIGIN